MTDIQVPTTNLSSCAALAGALLNRYGIMVSGSSTITPPNGNVPCYWRLSAQVYLEQSDFVRLGVLVHQLLAEFGDDSWSRHLAAQRLTAPM